jgi:hypothetical protein
MTFKQQNTLAALSISNTQHNNALACAVCCYVEFRIVFAIMLSVIMLNFVRLSVIMLNVVMLSIVAPNLKLSFESRAISTATISLKLKWAQ